MKEGVGLVSFCGICGHKVTDAYCGNCGQQTGPDADDGTASQQHRSDSSQRLPVPISEIIPPTPTPEASVHGPAPLRPPALQTRFGTAGTHRPPRLIVAATAAVLALLGFFGWALGRSGGNETAAAPTITTVVTQAATPTDIAPSATTTESPIPTPTPSKQLRDQAFATLQKTVADDARLAPIRGQWVAQLASKYEGVVDKSQQATPFTVPQILTEVTRLRADPEYGSLVRVVHQGDWANSTAGAKPMWVTMADVDMSSRDEVVAWCESHFAQRGKALLNVCYPRQMNPK